MIHNTVSLSLLAYQLYFTPTTVQEVHTSALKNNNMITRINKGMIWNLSVENIPRQSVTEFEHKSKLWTKRSTTVEMQGFT